MALKLALMTRPRKTHLLDSETVALHRVFGEAVRSMAELPSGSGREESESEDQRIKAVQGGAGKQDHGVTVT